MADKPTDSSSKGDEQKSPASSEGNADLAARLKELETQLASKDQVIQEKDKALKSKDNEARKLQAAADQRASLLSRLSNQQQARTRASAVPARPTAPAAAQPAQGVESELLDFANEQSKEVTLLREVVRRGLSLDEVDGVVFNTTAELTTQLDLLQQKKEIAELRSQLGEKQERNTEVPSGPKIDTGGRSVDEAQQQLTHANKFRENARELRSQGKHKEAVWMALRAARNDPTKIRPSRVSEEEEE